MSNLDVHIGEILARNARMYPDDVALIERVPAEQLRTEITWKQFDEGVNRFSNALLEKGIRKGDKVVHLELNSINWLIAYFGIVRTGAWAVPLNFRFTAQEIRHCCDVAEPRCVIFGETFTERVAKIRSDLKGVEHYIAMGRDVPAYAEPFERLVEKAPSAPPAVGIRQEDPCGLYFTSGTTGTPKPILLTHKNMISAAVTEKVHHHQTKDDNFILIPPLYHAGAKMHWFGNFIVGAKAVILKGFSPEWVLEAISEERGTLIFLLVPWARDILVKLDHNSLRLKDYDLRSWRLMHIGAQPVPPSVVKHWKEYFPSMAYDTNYGLTEATGPGCVHLGLENERRVGAIGLPGFNWETRVVNEEGIPVGRGEVGELIVRGDGVMQEYYKNPEETAKTLRDGWLYTGDMAKQDEEGFIYLVDRKKDVIISGGENIYPVEIEDFLHTHPKIRDVAAIGYPNERLGEVAAVVIALVPDSTLTEEEVVAFCEQLPKYKRPRKIFFGEVLRNATGKLDKPKLRKRYAGVEQAFKINGV